MTPMVTLGSSDKEASRSAWTAITRGSHSCQRTAASVRMNVKRRAGLYSADCRSRRRAMACWWSPGKLTMLARAYSGVCSRPVIISGRKNRRCCVSASKAASSFCL